MPKIVYVDFDGTAHVTEVPNGKTLMLAAQANNIAGILGECGGQAMCATCHVYVDEEYLSLLPDMSEDEDEMLSATASERKENSRLACQLTATEELDGLVLQLPETQL